MKKIVSILLVLAMMAALCICVFAEAVPGGNISGDTNGTVSVNVNKSASDTVYDVKVTWNSLAFTFDATEWDSENNVYLGSWAAATSTIDVLNKSNAPISIDAAFENYVNVDTVAEANGVTATLTNDNFTLASAATSGAATSGSVNVKVTGAPKADTFNVGNIIITISK